MFIIDAMKHLLIIATIVIFAVNSFGQKADTVSVQKQNLEFKYLRTGNSSYIVYFKKTATGPAEKITLVKINVEPTTVDGRKAYAVTQQWDGNDAVVHTSNTLHAADDFSTLRHDIWWKARGFTVKFDFLTRQVSFDGAISDAAKSRIVEDFNQSFESYNLSWHSDLTIFPLFPFRSGRTFKVNFYDPGAGKSKIAEYNVVGSEALAGGGGGEKIDCWIMEHKSEMPSGGIYTQRFWISKKTQEVLKEEDQFPGGFRYKLKIEISEEK